jgi:hypothetical protein
MKFKFKIGKNEYDLTKFKEKLKERQFDELLKDIIEKNAGKSLMTKKKEEEEYIKYIEKKYISYKN